LSSNSSSSSFTTSSSTSAFPSPTSLSPPSTWPSSTTSFSSSSSSSSHSTSAFPTTKHGKRPRPPKRRKKTYTVSDGETYDSPRPGGFNIFGGPGGGFLTFDLFPAILFAVAAGSLADVELGENGEPTTTPETTTEEETTTKETSTTTTSSSQCATITGYDYWVECFSTTSSGQTMSCVTTSTSKTIGCSPTTTVITTTVVPQCGDISPSDLDDQGEEGCPDDIDCDDPNCLGTVSSPRRKHSPSGPVRGTCQNFLMGCPCTPTTNSRSTTTTNPRSTTTTNPRSTTTTTSSSTTTTTLLSTSTSISMSTTTSTATVTAPTETITYVILCVTFYVITYFPYRGLANQNPSITISTTSTTYSVVGSPPAKRHVKHDGPSDTSPLLFPPPSSILAHVIYTIVLTQVTVSLYANCYTLTLSLIGCEDYYYYINSESVYLFLNPSRQEPRNRQLKDI
jgi:hypothetical protein